jgi:uncharacterized CHY-type Zn-finger protein
LCIVAIAEKRGEPEKAKSFWNTYYCQNTLTSFENRAYGRYCKNRHCTICGSIRKAEIINKYYPVLCKWQQPYFVTLTVKAHSAKDLKKLLKKVLRAFQLITAKYRKQHLRGKNIKLIGVKSLECCFNPIKRTYNPHLHVIVENKAMAEILIAEWLNKWTSKFAIRKAQHYRPVGRLDADLIEIIKYGSKIFTEPDINNKANSSSDRNIYAAALYNIFEAMKGLRIFDRFGFDLPNSPTKERKGARVVTEHNKWRFVAKYFDWLHSDNELTLSGYIPNVTLVNLLENCIDSETD